MSKESVARISASVEQAPGDSQKAQKRPDLARRVEMMNVRRSAEYKKFLEQNKNEQEVANDNNRGPSPEEIILQQEAKRRRRIEMLTEMTNIDQELEMQNGLDAQSEAYIAQQLQTVNGSQQELATLEAKQADIQKSFFKRTFGRLFGGEKKLNASIEKARRVYTEGRGMLEGAQDEYFRNKTGTVELARRSEALHAEADRLDQEIAQFISFEEKDSGEVEKTPEENAREQLFAGMTAEELKEQQGALRSERAMLQESAKSFEKEAKQLQTQLQGMEGPMAVIRGKADQFGEFLKTLNVEHEHATQRLVQAESRHKELNASFWSRLVNKQEILTLEERIKEEKTILQGLDHHFVETQTQVAYLHASPEFQISQKKQAELVGQLNKLAQKQELTRKRMIENDLQLTEAELALNRMR